MKKKLFIIILLLSILGTFYWFTRSIKVSLILFIYSIWVIRFELGINLTKERRERRIKKMNDSFKKDLEKHRKNNSAI